jgi:hypothetical protein
MRYGIDMDAETKCRNVTLTVKNMAPELAQAPGLDAELVRPDQRLARPERKAARR